PPAAGDRRARRARLPRRPARRLNASGGGGFAPQSLAAGSGACSRTTRSFRHEGPEPEGRCARKRIHEGAKAPSQDSELSALGAVDPFPDLALDDLDRLLLE